MTTAPKHTIGSLTRRLDDLARQIPSERATAVGGVAYDSRVVRPGDLFCCVPGRVTDGHEFAAEAVAAGAVALCVEHPLDLRVPQVVVSDVRKAMARIAATIFGDPGDRLLLLGVTGTNGKTTSSYLLEAILRADGHSTGLIGTVETRIAGARRPGVRTTPESVDLQALLAEMIAARVDAVAMEVTSHALALSRTEGLRFQAAAFTNLSQDHLDFHTGMEDYFHAKRSLFTGSLAERGAVNVDDPYGRQLVAAASVPCMGFGLSPEADVRATDVSLHPTGTNFTIVTPKGDIEITSGLVGAFNVYNSLAAAATSLQAGIALDAIERGLRSVAAVPGRFESIDAGQPFSVIVDYAHTPDSLDNVLGAARGLAERSGGKVVSIFGCGGDRDRGKRPLMGAIAARSSDYVIVTSDNPRSEDPRSIIDEILAGVIGESPAGPDEVHVDRRDAIAAGIAVACPGDVVVIAGKGHEPGQEFADRTVPFDDREVAREALGEAGWGGTR